MLAHKRSGSCRKSINSQSLEAGGIGTPELVFGSPFSGLEACYGRFRLP